MSFWAAVVKVATDTFGQFKSAFDTADDAQHDAESLEERNAVLHSEVDGLKAQLFEASQDAPVLYSSRPLTTPREQYAKYLSRRY